MKGLPTAFGLLAIVGGTLIGVVLIQNWERPPVIGIQHGFRGTAMDVLYNPRTLSALAAANKLPDPVDKVDPSGTPSGLSKDYQNIKVLKSVDSNEFLRDMSAITEWVSPQQSCNYCHNQDNLADDSLYTKVVARRMIQMVQYINSHWKSHVGATGVTCYTCHRGNPVPSQIWYENPGPARAGGLAETDVGKNHPAAILVNDESSLPYDPFTPFLLGDANIRVQSTQALPGTDYQSIKQTDWTYSLMIHFSKSLGVNCTYCHDSRSWESWPESMPQRVTAWYGIRMVRALNNDYLAGLHGVFPAARLGKEGDVPKINCATCHQGVYKPLYGASMIGSFPELTEATDVLAAPPPAAAPAPAAPPAPATPPAAAPKP
jgi:photosynthetic reaction center cytochrome c subunit